MESHFDLEFYKNDIKLLIYFIKNDIIVIQKIIKSFYIDVIVLSKGICEC